MALISCPECGKEISDKVKACPHCGYPFVEEQVTSESEPQRVEVTSIKLGPKDPKKRKTTLIVGIIAVIAIIVIIITVFVVKERNNAASRAEYIDNLVSVRMIMLSGAAKSETLCNLTKSVWYNTIHEESDIKTDPYTKSNGKFYDDFNDSLAALYSDSSTLATIDDIKENQEEVAAIMRELQNPPEDLTACYNTVESMYDTYRNFTNLAISPSGSLTSFSQDFRTYDNDFMDFYEKLDMQIPSD